MRAITENIENEILSQLSKAEKTIDIAVAWITAERLIKKIEEKKQQGIRIRILCWKDEEGQDRNARLKNIGGLKKDFFEIYESKRMHFKICIIDGKTLIKGSYNWTEAAKSNTEEISIEDEAGIVSSYQQEFDKLRDSIIREIDNKNFKNEILKDSRNEVIETFEQNIQKYINQLSSRNQQVFEIIDTKLNEQKQEIKSFEKRTKFYKSFTIISVVLLLISLCTIVITAKITIEWYHKSVMTKQEARQELLDEFNAQNKKLFDADEYEKLKKTNDILEEWISKNPNDSRKFREFRLQKQ